MQLKNLHLESEVANASLMRMEAFSSDFQQMLMMREEEHLSGLCQLGQNAKTRFSTLIIEVDKEVVSQHRQYGTALDGLFNRSDAQGQKELVNGALAHVAHRYGPGVIGTVAEQHRRTAIVVH